MDFPKVLCWSRLKNNAGLTLVRISLVSSVTFAAVDHRR